MSNTEDSANAATLVTLATAVLRSHPYGFLVTASPEGAPDARLVQPLDIDDSLRVFIGTSPRSRKAQQIALHPDVAYAAEDRPSFAYASLRAKARIHADIEVRVAKWQPGLEAFFPDGPEGDDFVVVELQPVRVELMDFAHGVHPQPYGLVPAVVERRGARWIRVGAHRG